jgi:hypothetical protein
MTFDRIGEGLTSLLEAIDECLQRRWVLPALVLIYTGIDVLAAMQKRQGEGTRRSFERWADSYMIRPGTLPCTSTDLYAARCGVLHAFTAQADLIKKGLARPIGYAWGSATAEKLDKSNRILRRDSIALHLMDLRNAFFAAVTEYVDFLLEDPSRYESAARGAGGWLGSFPSIAVDILLELVELTGPLDSPK